MHCYLKDVSYVMSADTQLAKDHHMAKVKVNGINMDKPQKEKGDRIYVNKYTVYYRGNSNY